MRYDVAPSLHDAQAMRQANSAVLALALMQARNLTLRRLAAFEVAEAEAGRAPAPPRDLPMLSPPRWLAGHAGWFQEYWIARNVQRHRGRGASPGGTRLASLEPQADLWWHPRLSRPPERWQLELPGWDALRRWLADTLEVTLELLSGAEEADDRLYFFRAALQIEDQTAEALAVTAQALDVPPAPGADVGLPADWAPDGAVSPWPAQPARLPRDALAFGARHWQMGSERTGAAPDIECPPHDVVVPEFEIDAQTVSWAQFAEFVDDGGYRRPEFWFDTGAAWLERHQREDGPRLPRYVEQMRHGVAVRRLGRVQRAAAAQCVLHVTWHEAQAWCRWAGRRLPTEPEWELAAATGAGRGFVHGDAWEWTAGSAQAYPGYVAGPLALPLPGPGRLRVLRGGSWMSSPRQRHARARRFVTAERDDLFCGFRSCAL